jgi:serine/threonine protein phosphatase PrpC
MKMKAVVVLLFSWWRNLWKAWRPGRRGGAPRFDPLSTVDFPHTLPSMRAGEGSLTYRLRVGVVSTVGTVREHNEDNFYIPGRTLTRQWRVEGGPGGHDGDGGEGDGPSEFGPANLFVVADGMGGQLAGEKASEMAVEIIPRELARRLGTDAPDDDRALRGAIRESVAIANQDILSLSSIATEYANMGTTVVLALFRKDRAYITGIGDSRAYRLRNGKLEQLTKDHSLADALGEAGTIAREEVATHKFKNVLYLYLGCKDALEGPEEVRVLDVRPGDRFLLASDGLTGVVKDDQLAKVLREVDDPQEAAQRLVDQALANLSKDNVTCLVIHVV